ncbi:MAG: hypothetical protein ACRCTZ_17035, partial [Sarcina sp.]
WTINQYRGNKIYKSGGIVNINLSISNGTTTYSTPVFNLPVGYRPVGNYDFSVMYLDGTTYKQGTMYIDSANGNVCINTLSGNRDVFINVTFGI